ncbi:MAG: rhomboid family intramembrane serine protease [Bacteroidota bacterium]
MPFRYQRDGNYNRPGFFGGFTFFPPVIKSLLLSNAIVFLLLYFLGPFEINGIPLIMIIDRVFALNPFGHGFRLWQLFTYMFMHSGLIHIFFNMLMLWMFGMELENTWGSRRFFIYYIVCGIGGGIANLIFAPIFSVAAPTVGASGAVFGIMIAFGMMFPDRPVFMFPIFFPIRAKFLVAILIFVEILAVTGSEADTIAHFAHLGGAAVGYIMILIDMHRFPFQKFIERLRRRTRMHIYTPGSDTNQDIFTKDAEYSDIHEEQTPQSKSENQINQERIDQILDKISKGGYQSLTEEEKRILFEASKKLN